MTRSTTARVSRRAFVGGAAAAIGLTGGAIPLAATPIRPQPSAIAFDGDALIVADDPLRRGEAAGARLVALPVMGVAVCALATHPERPGRIHAGLASGGLGVSRDGGRTWAPQGAGLPARAVSAMAVAAARPDTLYAALRGDGLWRSEDAGASWAFVMDRPWLEEAEREVLTLASVELASGMGGIWLYAGTETGLTRVPDCFCRWQDVRPGDAMEALAQGTAPAPEAPLPRGEAVRSLICAPSAPERLHAALPSGLWSSSNAGAAWTRVSAEEATALAVSPTDPDHLAAAAMPGGLIHSRDGGGTWSAPAAL